MKRLYEKKRNNFRELIFVFLERLNKYCFNLDLRLRNFEYFSLRDFEKFLVIIMISILFQTLSEVLEYIYTCKELNFTNYMPECSDYLL